MQRTKWAIAFVMMVLGILLTTQFRVTQQQSPTDPGRLRADELSRALQNAEKELESSNQERTRLRAELEKLRNAAPKPAVQPAPRRDPATEILAGTIEVAGPGVVVTMVEATDSTAAQARVSDEDLWRVVNELLAAGAEAISVNGQRLSSTTGIRNVGQRIYVNTSMIASPIEVRAIGNAQVLEASLKLRGGVVEVLDRWGIKVTVRRAEKVIVPPLRIRPPFDHAKPTTP